MFPTIPENVNDLSAPELRALAGEIREAIIAALTGTCTAEQRAEAVALRAVGYGLAALALTRDEDAAVVDELSAEQAAAAQAEADRLAAVAAAEVGREAGDGTGDDGTGGDDGDGGGGGGDEQAQRLSTRTGMQARPSGGGTALATRLAPEYLTVADGVDGKRAGETFESWGELASMATALADTIHPSSERQYTLAKIKGNYPAERILSDGDHVLNAAKFEPSEIQASLCAPATPYYDISCMSTRARPVFNSLPQFQESRMKVSIMSSPTLTDITAGYGVWTAAMDADANARKNCAVITCGSPTEYEMYGIWRCLTVKNMLAMSYPELVEAWLNKLGAAWARLAEQTLLEAMAAGVTHTLSTRRLGYGGSTSITTTIMTYLALFRESERWDLGSDTFDAWLPRWVQVGIQLDIARRRQTNGGMPQIPTGAQVDQMFRNAGVDPHWFIDTPSWATAIPKVGTSTLLDLPAFVQILLAPKGKFALMDRGELSIGVTGNHIYRDNSSNAQNQYTYFFESFEGIVNTNTCPAHILDIPVCWNGAQIDDIVINCQGGDEIGYQS